MAAFHELLARLDVDPRVRARQFEELCCWYLLNAPEYRLAVRRVWLWSEWPDRWGADAGVDLVVETVTDELWAVQVKAYDPSYAIKKADVDSFLSESGRPQFAYRLLIATTDLLGATARRTLAHQEKPAGLLLLSQLETEQLEWPNSLDDLRPIPQETKSPRPHQEEAIQAVCDGLETSDRGQLVMACGTGKTLVALWTAERLRSERTLVLLPSLSLLEQTLREWTANAISPFAYLAVCSDETVAEPDAFVASTSELGLPVTTEAAAIASFLARPGRQVVFSTYQSSPRIAAAQDAGAPAFDLVLADEAHRCAGQASSDFATVLDAARIRGRHRLFMTATPRYFTGRLRREAAQMDVEIASMDDEERFGPVLHRLGFAEAIARDLLSDYQVLIVGVSDQDHQDLAERGVFVTADGARTTDARTLASQLALLKAMRSQDLRRVVSFHSRVRRARDFSSSLPEVTNLLPADERPTGRLRCDFVSGEMPSGQRRSRLARFRDLDHGERALLANARCLGEGVDIPAIDGIAFIDPRRSQIDIVQAVGRAIRRSDEKKLGTIVLPVFVDADADPERALEDSSFSNVWDVLKALRAHDDELGEQLDELRRELGRHSINERPPAKIRLELPMRVGEDFVRAFDARLIKETTATWEFWYGLLERFVAENQHADVPRLHIADGAKLGQWVSMQRRAFNTGRLARRLALAPLRRLEVAPAAVGFSGSCFIADRASRCRFGAEP